MYINLPRLIPTKCNRLHLMLDVDPNTPGGHQVEEANTKRSCDFSIYQLVVVFFSLSLNTSSVHHSFKPFVILANLNKTLI